MSKWPYSTATWQRLREAKLSNQPLCEACLRRDVVEPAVAVDHVVSIASGGKPFPPLDGLMSMCEPCHNAKTNAVDHPSASGFRRALKGYDVNGNPIDPSGWEPGAEAGRAIDADGPARESRVDLVSCEPFATGNPEAERWV